MPKARTVRAYTDYKSPYAYLAKDLTYELERDFTVRVDWLPYVLDIPSFLGSARGDAAPLSRRDVRALLEAGTRHRGSSYDCGRARRSRRRRSELSSLFEEAG